MRACAQRSARCAGVLDELVAARTREGEKLAAAVLERVQGMRARLEHRAAHAAGDRGVPGSSPSAWGGSRPGR